MSRLLDSLREAQQERSGKPADAASPVDQSKRRLAPQPGYFWSSLFWLAIVFSLILGGFLLLQHALYGIEAGEWLQQRLPHF